MAKTNNIPPEFQALVLEAIERAQARRQELIAEGKILDVTGLTKEVYNELAKTLKNNGTPEEEFPPGLRQHIAKSMRRVVGALMAISEEYPPTHRKGYGDSDYKEITNVDPLFFLKGGGGSGGPPQGPGDPNWPDPEEPDDEEDDWFEWVPDAEQSRAKDMLHAMKAELDFGYFDEPLPFVREVARALGGRWGLNGKRGNPNDPSGDILAYDFPGHQPQLFDVLIDGGGKNEVTWSPLAYPQRYGAVWLAP